MESLKLADGPRGYLVQRAIDLVVPIGVHIDVTYRCDLDCVHCYLADRERDELTLDEYRRLFAELRELGTLFLLVSGGELFYRADGVEILREARKQRFDVRIITHGGHIDDSLADELAELDIITVGISIYGADAATHDAITRVAGSFERTVSAARSLRRAGVKVGLKCVLMSRNRDVVDGVRALAKTIGTGLDFSFDIRGDNLGSDAPMALNMELGERLAVMDCVYPRLVEGDAIPAMSPDQHTCLVPHASCYIGPDGTVTPCLEWTEVAGNIRDTSFAEIWRDAPLFKRARLIRRSSFQGCSDCESFSVCGLCPARSHRETGDPTGRAPSKCRQTKAKLIGFESRRGRDRG